MITWLLTVLIGWAAWHTCCETQERKQRQREDNSPPLEG